MVAGKPTPAEEARNWHGVENGTGLPSPVPSFSGATEPTPGDRQQPDERIRQMIDANGYNLSAYGETVNMVEIKG